MAKNNKFASAFRDIRQTVEPEEPEVSADVASADEDSPEVAEAVPVQQATRKAKSRGPGRPRGKRSDPKYRQVTGLITKQTHLQVSKALLEERINRPGYDTGALMEELFQRWLKERKGR